MMPFECLLEKAIGQSQANLFDPLSISAQGRKEVQL